MGHSSTILSDLKKLSNIESDFPAFFIGHGSPMNAIEQNAFTEKWTEIGETLPIPKAILCISAHWETSETFACVVSRPKTIHDFVGFPKQLYEVRYSAPGSPEFSNDAISLVKKTTIRPSNEWGLDHGSWSFLSHMFPLANIPIFQISLDYTKPPQWHYELAAELKLLRKKGVLIIGSGNIVHNLRLMRRDNPPFEWADAFDQKINSLIIDRNHRAIIEYRKLGAMADLSVPSNEHFLPLLYTLGCQNKSEEISFFNEEVVLGSVSMQSFRVG
jgi:4,5-DOPA dioxygenase extradiol